MPVPAPTLLPPGSSPATTRPAFAPVCVTTAAASLTSSPQRLAVVSVVRRARTVTWIAGGLGVLVVSGEYPVQRLARIRQDLARVPHLGVGPRAHDLERGHGDLTDEVAHLDSRVSDRARHDVPGRPDLLWVRVNVGAALLGQPVAPATAVARLGADQALVLELLQRGIDRTGARTPHAVAPLADRLDDLVAIHRLLGQQRQRRRTDVASLCPRPAHPAQARIAKPGPEHVEARRAAMTRDRHGHPPTGEPGAADMTATAAAAPPHELLITAAPPALFLAPAPVAFFFLHQFCSLSFAPAIGQSQACPGLSPESLDRSTIYRYTRHGKSPSSLNAGKLELADDQHADLIMDGGPDSMIVESLKATLTRGGEHGWPRRGWPPGGATPGNRPRPAPARRPPGPWGGPPPPPGAAPPPPPPPAGAP